ncbi:MAG: type VI secretion system lipoprotein TssJ [Gammaproteobacteria bacterium]
MSAAPVRLAGHSSVFICLALSIGISGCSVFSSPTESEAPETPAPTIIELQLDTSKDLNLDIEGNGTPIVARYYELKSADGFSNADFFAIYERDKETLGTDIVFREELYLTPEESRKIRLEAKPDSHFIGVFGAFKDLENAQWRAIREIPARQTTRLEVHFSKNSVTIQVAEDKPLAE